MKTYVWKDRIGVEYIAFAETMDEAKAVLRKHYDGKDLDEHLFNLPHNRRVKIRKMPKGLCSMDPDRTVWIH